MSKIGDYMDEIDGIDMQIRNLKYNANQPPKGVVISCLTGLVIGYVGFSGITMMILMRFPSIRAGMFSYIGMVGMIGMVVGAIIGARIPKIASKKEHAELNKKIENLKQRRESLENEWVSILSPHWDKVRSIVPENYASPLFIQMAYGYLTNGRADSMKEAINLFEEEQHRNRMEQGIKDMQEQYQQEMENVHSKMAELENRVRWAEHTARVADDLAHPF